MDGAQWQVDLTTEDTWPVVDVEMLETRALAETSEGTVALDIIKMATTETEADVLTAACELINAEVC